MQPDGRGVRVLRRRLSRRRLEEPVERSVDNQPRPRRNRVIEAGPGIAVDRDDTRAERRLDLADGVPGDIVAVGDPVGKPGQRAIAFGKLDRKSVV